LPASEKLLRNGEFHIDYLGHAQWMAICRRRRADHHQPLSIEFVDGPIAGVHDIPEVRLEASVLLISDHKLFRGVGDPAAVAVYTLAELDGKS
jgi:hypothetical protein